MPDKYQVFDFICPCGYETTVVNDKRRFNMLRRLHTKKCEQCTGKASDIMDTVYWGSDKGLTGNRNQMLRKTHGEPTPLNVTTRYL